MTAAATPAPVLPHQTRAAEDRLRLERDALVRILTMFWPAHLMLVPDTTKPIDWQWVVCIHAPTGQLTWRLPEAQLEELGLEREPENHRDTQSSVVRLERLASVKRSQLRNGPSVGLKAAIQASGRKQKTIARLARIHVTKLSHIVAGRRLPSARERRNLAKVLGKTESELGWDLVPVSI